MNNKKNLLISPTEISTKALLMAKLNMGTVFTSIPMETSMRVTGKMMFSKEMVFCNFLTVLSMKVSLLMDYLMAKVFITINQLNTTI